MAITYFGSASTPADNSTNVATTTAVTPPASTTTGDLIVLIGYQRGSATMSISDTGGQTWNTGPYSSALITNGAVGVFWCTFNGTWSADPSILFSAGTNTNVVMHVFRPSSSSNQWGIDDNINNWGLFGGLAPSSPFTCTSSSWTNTTNASTVALALFVTADDNTWSTLSGTGWVETGGTQYRNTSGQDMSSTYAHNIRTSAGAIANVSKNQATLGGDDYVYSRLVWYEYTPVPPRTPRPTSIGHPFIF